ncbi:putative O-methyltransferase YrrM [Parabacteroides sp. PFB2-10]|uniref:SAM-dependent methyltransferase n=1 Tax=Parabacteroides sp. PFB2-10 TaxID=1742405 RepID=UPI002473D86B|nr:SAM-dependent methyltransferase [Parabacteroides sp. PFB2-10]MDH6312181.1 putative O-methyltransferase YrrM [Parabacteroides sp. PFB2-10]MDL2244846.1 SAM-dependent methyltransferase [Parabacteroides sp. OttesenSCG-928-J18]
MKRFIGKQIQSKHIARYRRLFRTKGHGVHSPFVFNLLTKVIGEKGSYYRFKEIELLRKRLLQNKDIVVYPDSRRPLKERKTTVGELVRKEAVSPKTGALLFRLTHYFRSERILQIGSSMGLSTLYLTSYAPDLLSVSLEPEASLAAISQWVYDEAARTAIDQRSGDFPTQLDAILQTYDSFDFIFFCGRDEQYDTLEVFNRCKKQLSQEGVCVIEGIRRTKKRLAAWKTICEQPEVTVTLDLYNIGILFVNPKWHKRHYKLYY